MMEEETDSRVKGFIETENGLFAIKRFGSLKYYNVDINLLFLKAF